MRNPAQHVARFHRVGRALRGSYLLSLCRARLRLLGDIRSGRQHHLLPNAELVGILLHRRVQRQDVRRAHPEANRDRADRVALSDRVSHRLRMNCLGRRSLLGGRALLGRGLNRRNLRLGSDLVLHGTRLGSVSLHGILSRLLFRYNLTRRATRNERSGKRGSAKRKKHTLLHVSSLRFPSFCSTVKRPFYNSRPRPLRARVENAPVPPLLPPSNPAHNRARLAEKCELCHTVRVFTFKKD